MNKFAKTTAKFVAPVALVGGMGIAALGFSSGVAGAATGEEGPSAQLIAQCGGEENIKGSSCQRTLRVLSVEFGEKGVVNTRLGEVRLSGDDVTKGGNLSSPGTFSQPIWNQPTIGGVGIETSAGGLNMADSQANR